MNHYLHSQIRADLLVKSDPGYSGCDVAAGFLFDSAS